MQIWAQFFHFHLNARRVYKLTHNQLEVLLHLFIDSLAIPSPSFDLILNLKCSTWHSLCINANLELSSQKKRFGIFVALWDLFMLPSLNCKEQARNCNKIENPSNVLVHWNSRFDAILDCLLSREKLHKGMKLVQHLIINTKAIKKETKRKPTEL